MWLIDAPWHQTSQQCWPLTIMPLGTSVSKIRNKIQQFSFKEMHFNTLRPRQNGRHFADDIFKCIFLNENTSISIDISLKFVPEGRINNIPALVQIMAWRRLGDKPLSEPMMVSLLAHICVTRPQWVNPISKRCNKPKLTLQHDIWPRQDVRGYLFTSHIEFWYNRVSL